MDSRLSRRSFGIAALATLTGLAACARPAPPPPAEAPPPPPPPPAAPPAPPPPPPAAEAPPAPPPPPTEAGLTTTHRAYLHLRPAGRVVAVLPPGTPVERIGPGRGPWAHVHTPRGNGWVLRRDLAPA
jgi:hypothetical protein